MRLYFTCPKCGEKSFYLGFAYDGWELLEREGPVVHVFCTECQASSFLPVYEIKAEPSGEEVRFGAMMLGGFLGLLAFPLLGPAGVLIFAVAGFLFGSMLHEEDVKAAKKFNRTVAEVKDSLKTAKVIEK